MGKKSWKQETMRLYVHRGVSRYIANLGHDGKGKYQGEIAENASCELILGYDNSLTLTGHRLNEKKKKKSPTRCSFLPRMHCG